VSDGYDLNKWVPLHQRDMLAVARGEEEIYFLDAKVSGHSSVEALAKQLNDRVELLDIVRCLQAAVVGHINGIPNDLKTQLDRATAAITTAEGK
jgi:hypothetical protein